MNGAKPLPADPRIAVVTVRSMPIYEYSIYVTTDGKEFLDAVKAIKHQGTLTTN